MASTWATTADNQLITGATLRNIPFYYPYIVDGVIPLEYDTRIVTAAFIESVTTASGVVTPTNRCPTAGEFAGQY
jgi:hypothetical protein